MTLVPLTVTDVSVRPGYRLVVVWSDGSSSLISMSRLIRRQGLYGRLQGYGVFNKVRVGEGGGSIEWSEPVGEDGRPVVVIPSARLRIMLTEAPRGEGSSEETWVTGFLVLLDRMDARLARIESMLEALEGEPVKPDGLKAGSRGSELIAAARAVPRAEYVRFGEVTRRFGIAWTKLYHLAAAGEINLVSVKGAMRVDVVSVRAWLARQPLVREKPESAL